MLLRPSIYFSLMASAVVNTLSHAATTAESITGESQSLNDGYASYVILGQAPDGSNTALARTIIATHQQCPKVVSLEQTPQVIPMVTRDNHHGFTVLVCEALIQFDQQYAIDFGSHKLPLPEAKSSITHVQVFGDTGCKPQKPGKSDGCAEGSPAQPFNDLADAGAAGNPDLVLHMGDYNYRGTSGQTYYSQMSDDGSWQQVAQWPYDAGDSLGKSADCGQSASSDYYSQSAINANHPDIWQNWQQDLFVPAQSLMLAAPWIATRGNHELCSRAGPGYFYFMDSHSNVVPGDAQMYCPEPDEQGGAPANTQQIPNYKLQFKGQDIAVVDSANACDSYAPQPYLQVYQQVFADLQQQVQNVPTWLVTHRPIWGVESYDPQTGTPCSQRPVGGQNGQYGCINQMLQKAIALQKSQALPASINLVLTGHMHQFESVSFPGTTRPANIVVGSSGVALSASAPFGAIETEVDGLSAKALSTSTHIEADGQQYDAFGYLQITLNGGGEWQGKLVNPSQKLTLAICDSQQQLSSGVCELAEGVSHPD